MARKSKDTICYICGERAADSDDHVIPESYFPPPRPEGLLKLPAHIRCQRNRRMGQSEQWLRAICSNFGPPGSSGETIWEGVAKRYFERNQPMCEALRESMRPFGLAGLPVIPVHPILYFALEKIVKGLYYHHTHKVTGWTEFDCKVLNFASDDDPERSNRGVPGISFSDVFKSRYLIDQKDTEEVSFWWLEFYHGITFRCCCR